MENTESEKELTDEEIVKAFIENDKKLKADLNLDSLDEKNKLILLKYRINAISNLIDNMFKEQQD